jgi:L-lactate dehydrogenase
MKIGIIGAGAVGAACAIATVMRGCASELVLVNRSRDRAKGMATDMGYGAPLSSTTRVTDGDYSDLAEASLIMVTVGINEKSGGRRIATIRQGAYASWTRMPRFIARLFRRSTRPRRVQCCLS